VFLSCQQTSSMISLYVVVVISVINNQQSIRTKVEILTFVQLFLVIKT